MAERKWTTTKIYLRRFLSQASLISRTTIITMVVTRIGAANIANIVSILKFPQATMPVNVQSEGLFQSRG